MFLLAPLVYQHLTEGLNDGNKMKKKGKTRGGGERLKGEEKERERQRESVFIPCTEAKALDPERKKEREGAFHIFLTEWRRRASFCLAL